MKMKSSKGMLATTVGIFAGFACLAGVLGISNVKLETTDLALIIALSISILVPLISTNAESQKDSCKKQNNSL
jgi:hypothetical protein